MKTCYTKHDNIVSSNPDNTPCSTGSGYQQCCATGDECGADGFCHFTHAQDNIVTGYYLGGCTDPSFEAAVCPQPCTQYGTQDVLYEPSYGLWACCYGSGSLNCQKPGNETFAAPAAAKLFATSSSAAATSSTTSVGSTRSSPTSSPSTRSSSTASPSSSATGGPSSHSGSSTTTIAVAVAIPVVAVLVAIGLSLWWMRRKRRARQQVQNNDLQGAGWVDHTGKGPAVLVSDRMVEMAGDRERVELSNNSTRQELAGDPVSELSTEKRLRQF